MLEEVEPGIYRLEVDLNLPPVPGRRRFGVRLSQQLSGELLQIRLSHELVILPVGDLIALAGEKLPEGWAVAGGGGAVPELGRNTVFEGEAALAAAVRAENVLPGWNVDLLPAAPLETAGYRALRFSFHPGSAQLPEQVKVFSVGLRPGKTVNLLREKLVDMTRRQWQVVEIPLERFELKGPVESIRFAGNLEGTFYLGEVRLVAVRPPTTAVEETQASRPAALALGQNYPNPFNSRTEIPLALPAAGPVELAVYDLVGQRVAVLIAGALEAGAHRVSWEGQDGQGRPLASGVYLCRLRVGQWSESRKLVLLR